MPGKQNLTTKPMINENTQDRVCKDYLQNKCNGLYCLYAHPEPQSFNIKTTPKSKFCFAYNSTNGCQRSNCSFLHRRSLKIPCPFYFSTECKMGEYCKKTHSLKIARFNQQSQYPSNTVNSYYARPPPTSLNQQDIPYFGINQQSAQPNTFQHMQYARNTQYQPPSLANQHQTPTSYSEAVTGQYLPKPIMTPIYQNTVTGNLLTSGQTQTPNHIQPGLTPPTYQQYYQAPSQYTLTHNTNEPQHQTAPNNQLTIMQPRGPYQQS